MDQGVIIADLLAQNAHAGQVDKAGRPYIEHVRAVSERTRELGGSQTAIQAALLHDVLEDTTVTQDDLRAAGFGEDILAVVLLVTRTPERGTYMDFIRSIAESGNRDAILVKLADNWHNSLPERIAALPPDMRDIAKRYERARKILTAALPPPPA